MDDYGSGSDYNYDDDDQCSIIPPEPLRLILVGVIGTSTSLVSLLFNTFLFAVLSSSASHRSSHVLYLIMLALFDTFISVSYILIFPINLFMDWFASVTLADAWWIYMRPVLTMCHVTMSTSGLLIMVAACERYMTISRYRLRLTQRDRIAISIGAILFAILAKAPLYFELQVIPNANCTGVTANSAIMADFTDYEPYKTLYRFWFRNIISIFVPFFACLYFNVQIVRRLRQQQTGARLFNATTSEHRQNIRSATRMLVLVTCTYLLSNLLNVIVTVWEFIDVASLLQPHLRPLYTFSSDLASLLTVVSSAVRLPIYCACNSRIRYELIGSIRYLCRCPDTSPSSDDAIDSTPIKGQIIVASDYQSIRRSTAATGYGTAFDRIIMSIGAGRTNSYGNAIIRKSYSTSAIL